MSERGEVISLLEQGVFYDLTNLDHDRRQRWFFCFTKLHQNEPYITTWLEDVFAAFKRNAILERTLRFYSDFFMFEFKNGMIEILMGKPLKDKDKTKIKESLKWEQGNIVALLPNPDDKDVGVFELFPMDKLNFCSAHDAPDDYFADKVSSLKEELQRITCDSTVDTHCVQIILDEIKDYERWIEKEGVDV